MYDQVCHFITLKLILFTLQNNTQSTKEKKSGSLKGFDGMKGEETARRLKLWGKNTVELKWHNWCIEKACYTYLIKTV